MDRQGENQFSWIGKHVNLPVVIQCDKAAHRVIYGIIARN